MFWCQQQLTVCLTAPDGSQTIRTLPQPFAIVGSHVDCDVHVDDAEIDARSMFVCITHAGLAVLVLAPKAKKAGQALRIRAGQAIPLREWSVSFSATSLSSSDVGPAANPVASTDLLSSTNPVASDATPPPDAAPLYSLTWISPSGRQYLQLRNEHPIVIGRKLPSNLVLADDRLSGLHCCVIRSADKMWAVDLGSTNGTLSNGQRQRVHEIEPDRSICIGRQRLHFTRLFADQQRHELLQQLIELRRQLEHARNIQLSVVADNTMQQSSLLASLRFAQEQADQQRQQFELEQHKHEQLVESQHQRLIELEEQQQLAAQKQVSALAEMQTSIASHQAAAAALQQSVSELQHQVEQLEQQRRELDAQLANRETDLAQREQELDLLAERLSEQQRETLQLTQELVVERGILKNLELELQREEDSDISHLADDEHCVASPDFHAILDEALGSLPSLEEPK